MNKISIIIPVFNLNYSNNFLKTCINSLDNDLDILEEIILVDDGSTDGTDKLCDSLAEDNKIIKVIHQTNGGVSNARNTGLKHAKGKYIWFVDGDDYVKPEALSTINRFLEKEFDAVHIGIDYVYSDSSQNHFSLPLTEKDCLSNNDEICNEIIRPAFGRSLNDIYDWYKGSRISKDKGPVGVCSCIMKREIISANSIKFKENLTIAEDQMFFCEYLSCCSNCAVVHLPLYCYYQRSSSAMHTSLNDYNRVISNRLIEVDTRTEIVSKHINLEQYCQGTIVLTAVEVCYMCANNHSFKKFAEFCRKDLVKKSFKKLKLKGAQIKMIVAFLPLKLHLYMILYLICKLCVLFKINISPD